jgi:predicted hotdog family 3-hydroxylacyl-ACP dehydratase
MMLLDRVTHHDDESTVCLAVIREDSAFREAGGPEPAWVSLEYMAQCVAAHSGLLARAAGQPVRIGVLIGCRRLVLRTPRFPVGQALEIAAQRAWGDATLGSFRCSVRDGASGTLLAEGTLSVALPDDLGALRKGQPG